jgi:nucleotide-binding universal stress UspA family protein
MMPGRILCAVESTPGAVPVVALALALARAKGAEVSLLHAVDRRDPEPHLTEALERLAAPLRAASIPVALEVVEGAPVQVILDRARTATLVVMGTHGGRGVERLVLGSVAENVLDHAPCPVATVRETFEGLIRRIVCGADLVDTAPLEAALTLARETGAEVILLHAVAELPEEGQRGLVPASYRPMLLAEARERLDASLAALDRTGLKIREVVDCGRPYRRLVHCAGAQSGSILVVGVHAHLFGGTTHHVVRESHCPVLTVRGDTLGPESSR